MADWIPFLVALMAFGAIGGIAFAVGQYYLRALKMRQRLPVHHGPSAELEVGSNIARLVAKHFGENRFGVDDTLRGKLRMNLVRAGYFRSDAVNFYVLWRVAAVIGLPIVTYLALELAFPGVQFASRLVIVAIAIAIGVVGPDAFISRRQRVLSAEYRIIFPDFLDLLVVCVDAGLTLEGAVNRIG